MKHFAKYLAFLTLLGACGGEDEFVVEAGEQYFPLKKGIFHIYDVHEIRYSAAGQEAESYYEIMTTVTDSFPAADGLYTYVIHRGRRQNESDAWQDLDTWSARKLNNQIIVSEGNTPFIKVTFPVRNDARWNGNAFNTLGEDEYEMTGVDQPREYNGMTFETTMTVKQEQNEDMIVYRDERTEVYAAGVGLVYKEVLQLNYCTDDDCLGQQKITAGIHTEMVIKEYGEY